MKGDGTSGQPVLAWSEPLLLPNARKLPHNMEAEMALLGTLLWRNRAYSRISDFLQADHFSYQPHRTIFSVIKSLIEAGHVADPVVLSVRDDVLAAVADIGGPAYLLRLADAATAEISTRDYGRMIADMSMRRELIALGDDLINRAYNSDSEQSPADIAAQSTSLILAATTGRGEASEWEDAAAMLDGEIPPRGWLLGTFLCREFFTILAADGGAGKTSLMIACALSLVTGRKLAGMHVHQTCNVMLLTFEDGRDELRRRLAAACKHHGVTVEELKGRLFVRCLHGASRTLAITTGFGAAEETGLANEIILAANRHSIGAIFADPFIKMSGVSENDNTAVDFVCRLLSRITDKSGAAACIAHHCRKGAREAGDIDATRGAKALIDAGRMGLTMSKMSAEEAKTFGIPDTDRKQYVRLDDGKANLSLMSDARWFRMVSVNLENGNADYPNGDNVQTMEPWSPPCTWDGMNITVIHDILDCIAAGPGGGERYSAAASAKDRAAWKVVQEFMPDKTEPQCREVINTWVKNGILVVEEFHSPSQRRLRDGLSVDDRKRPG